MTFRRIFVFSLFILVSGVFFAPVLSAQEMSATSSSGCTYIESYLWMGRDNSTLDVLKLQTFLAGFEGFEGVPLSGVFDGATFEAVSEFQVRYGDEILAPWGLAEPTGNVYITTRNTINELFCGVEIPLGAAELAEIESYRASGLAMKSENGSESATQGGELSGGQLSSGVSVDQNIVMSDVSNDEVMVNISIDEDGVMATTSVAGSLDDEGGGGGLALLLGTLRSSVIFKVILIAIALWMIYLIFFSRGPKPQTVSVSGKSSRPHSNETKSPVVTPPPQLPPSQPPASDNSPSEFPWQ